MKISENYFYQNYSYTLPQQNLAKNDVKTLKVLANEFTSLLLKQVFSSMRKTLPENKFIDGGLAEDIFTDMLDEEISKSGSQQGAFNNLSRLLYQQLSESQR